MGYGDEIMATGHVRELYARVREPVAILDKHARPRSHRLWVGNPKICSPQDFRRKRTPAVQHGYGCRPYVDTRDKQRWRFVQGYRPPVGELYLPRASPGDYVVVAPHVKDGALPGKRWPLSRYQAVLEQRRDVRWVQLGPRRVEILDGAQWIKTDTFEAACYWLAGARALLTNEGGLHHAAAALSVPAVVIFGGAVPVWATGYDAHINLAASGEACGSRAPCAHCVEAMDAISVERVLRALREIGL